MDSHQHSVQKWHEEQLRRRQLIVAITCIVVQVVHAYHLLFLTSTPHIPHTSTGEAWIYELMTGHPNRIRNALGVNLEVFEALVRILKQHGIHQSDNDISVEEQLGIFLYACVTGLSTHHLGERFQHPPDTIARYFEHLLVFFSGNPFYSSQVRLPTAETPISQKTLDDPRFRFFDQCIGAIDSTHIRVFASPGEHSTMRNRKGYLSQNCLFMCNHEFFFTYSLCGWDGSVADATLWNDACAHDLHLPPGKYLIADAGFRTLANDALLVPYCGVRYHLNEWCQANFQPQTPEELFNHRHASLRSVIERIFRVMKQQWRILRFPPEYELNIQARIPAALCALHNFIRRYDPTIFDEEYNEDLLGNELKEDAADLNQPEDGPPNAQERQRADLHRDDIARAMWDDFVAMRTARGNPDQAA